MRLVLGDVEVDGRRVDVLVEGARISSIAPSGALGSTDVDERIEGHGGVLLPGLHDHHLHLLATAAAARSVDLGAVEVRSVEDLARALAAAPAGAGGWVRALGYHESHAGPLDRRLLDRAAPTTPVRVQDASGARWTLNGAGLRAIGLDPAEAAVDVPAGVEVDEAGRPTGVVHRADRWLRERLPDEGPPPLADLGARLAALGVTGVTDTTPVDDDSSWHLLADAASVGDLPVRVTVTGSPRLAGATPPPPLDRGPCKVIVDDASLPAVDELVEAFRTAHDHGRAVAVHCVTSAALALALAAWDEVGARDGDRIEHGSVIPERAIEVIAGHDLIVVTQPGLVGERGARYLREVDPGDLDDLYRCRSLLERGVRVAAGSDAPYTDVDPWAAARAAVTRHSGDAVVGPAEALAPAAALALYQGTGPDPTAARTVSIGARADLVLAGCPRSELLRDLTAEHVAATIVGGEPTYRRPG